MRTRCVISLCTIRSLYTLLVVIWSFSITTVLAQPGKNGPLTVNSLNTVVNCYSAVTANVSSGSSSITTDNSCTLECGDLIMVYQAQGASINTTNTDQYGLITSYNSSGLYEFNYVVSNAGGVVTVQQPWVNSYSASGMTQVIKVPQYTTLTVNAGASIIPSAWQDAGSYRKGGLVVIHATGTVTVNGTIHANALGFREGVIEQNTSSSGSTVISDFVTTSASNGAEKGESIAGYGPQYDALGGRYGRGAPANGGGGGNAHNAGGGGGSNGNNGNTYNGQGIMCTSCSGSAAWLLDPFVIANGNVLTNSSGGGRGGYTYGGSNQNATTLGPNQTNWAGDYRKPTGGWGGKPLTITPASRIFFGGGGGAGDSNNGAVLNAGKGGGIVYIIAPSVAGSGIVSANGGDALNQVSLNTAGWNDAPAGGGGGGTIILKSAVSGTLTLNANGGKGGDQGNLATESEGPGGGGGGGYVAVTSGSPTVSTLGGANGITLSGSLTEFPPNGATSGANGQSQTVANTFIVYDPVSVTASVNTPVCAGNPLNFTSTVNYPGGTYAWTGPASFTSSAQNPVIASATVANSGSYRVIYTSPGGCKDTAYVTAVVNPTPLITVTPASPLCAGACNGSAAISFTATGTSPYTYLWSNGQTTQTASNLCPGSYSVTVTDFNGCMANGAATITAPPALTATLSPTSVSCSGACTGTVVAVGSGGVAPYQYSLNGGAFQTSGTFTGLCAGSYTVVVRDANNCTYSATTTVSQPAQLTLTLVSTVPTTCGTNNGSLTVSASGGTSAYTYSIGGAGQSSGTFNNLAAGSYTVTVTDAGGCTATVNAVVTSTNAPTASVLTQQNVSCFGGVNGSALIGITGGSSPYTYSLNSGTPQTSNLFSGLAAASYTVVVSDVNNCTASVSFTITSPTQLTYSTVVTPVTCNALCNGAITITPSGGTAPYSFSQNNGSTFSTANPMTGLCAGTINLVVKDGNGCLANSTVIVTQPTAISATTVNIDPTCHDECNGQVTVNASGGVAGYTYSIAGGAFQASNVLTNVCPGTQQIIVQDGNGCQLTQSTTLVNPPAIITSQVSMVESNCGFNNGSLEVSASGVNAPFQYALSGGPYQSTGVFTNLYGGAYLVVVEDAIGCHDTTYFGVNDIEMSGILLSMTDVTCFGGSDGTVEVTNVSGALPITYEFDDSGVTQTNGIFTGLDVGSHVVAIYDGGLCAFTIPFEIAQPDPIVFTPVVTDVTCDGGSDGQIAITGATGGTGAYQYSVDNGATFAAGSTFTGLTAGTYDVVVMDANNCVFNQQATIDESLPVSITSTSSNLVCFGDNSGFIQLDATGGNGGYQFSIDNGTTFSPTSSFVTLPAGTYDIVVNDQFGCPGTATIILTEPAQLTATHTTTAEQCYTACDGIIASNPSGGTGSYMFSTDGGVTFGVNNTISNLCAGNYTVLIRDQSQCQFTFAESIASAPALTLTQTVTASTCGNPNGAIVLNGSGGAGMFTYSIDNGTTYLVSGNFTGLAANTYNVSVQDGNGCVVDSVALLTNQASPFISGVYVTGPSCNNVCDASITVDAVGGTGTLQYTIGAGYQAANTFGALCDGTYNVVIMDANGCTDTAVTVITEPAILSFNSNGNNLSCNQNFSGSIQIVANGGTSPYQYSYDNGVTYTASSSLQFVAAGTYDLIVMDYNGCTVTGQEILTEPTAITSNVAITDATCYSFCDGAAQVTAGGGTPGPGGYTFTWSPNATTTVSNQASALCAGDYWVTIGDQNGCTLVDSFIVAEPVQFQVASFAITEPTCNGFCNGSITVNAPGGVSYSFDGGATYSPSNTITNICAGNYNIDVINAIGCPAATTVMVSEPDSLLLITLSDSLMCAGDTIELFSLAYGGTAPYQYSWDNGANTQGQVVHPTVSTGYTVFAIDNNGCVSPTHTVNLTMLPALNLGLSPDVYICQGSTLDLFVEVLAGTQPYSYSWSTSVNDTLPDIIITPTFPTTYTVTVTDACSSVDTTIEVLFYTIPEISAAVSNSEGCAPLTITLDTTGFAALTNCVWTFSDGQVINGCGNVSATFTEPGCYDLNYTGTTVDGCPLDLDFANVVCIHPDPVAAFTYSPVQPTVFDNQVYFYDQSQGASTYQWSYSGYGTSVEQNPSYLFYGIDPEEEVIVCQEVTSIYGCTDTTCKTISFNDEFIMYVPNAFTPDGDEYNNTFTPVFPEGAHVENYTLLIFDRWGEIIFESMNPNVGWGGSYHGVMAQDGVYTWVIELKDGLTNDRRRFVGHVSLLR